MALNGYDIYKFIEFVIFSLYLIFTFLTIQIWFLWKDVDKNELEIRTFINESFFKKNCMYVFSLSIFFMVHEVLEEKNTSNAILYFEFFEMLTLISLSLFAYEWYSLLKTSIIKRPLPWEFIDFTRH